MQLNQVIKGINILEEFKYDKHIEIHGIAYSDKILDENLFVCIKGEKFDTHNLMNKLQKKVDVFIVEEINKNIPICQIKVDNTRKILLKILFNFNYIDISKIKIVGVTGTNGKTTTTYYTKFLLEKLGYKVALIGTSGCYICNKKINSHLTTPNADELCLLIKNMIESGVDYLIMEVSAHAVKQFRIEGLNFVVGAFTNITEDHLDDFNSLYEYAYYKFLFLKSAKDRIINIDDKFGKEFATTCDVTISNKDVNATFLYSYNKNEFSIKFNKQKFTNKCNVLTDYNAFNLTLSLAIIYCLGIDVVKCFKFISCMPKVDGRYNLKRYGNKIVCIDYAHSPDALSKVLSNLKNKTLDLIVVFGASGFRDMKKRQMMGKIASKFADYIILTADNPRYENVFQINAQISKYIKVPYVCIENRAKAIEHAYSVSKDGSVVAILGKGNEDYQDICAYNVSHNDEHIVTRIFGEGEGLID